MPGQDEPMRLPATGPVMGAFPGTLYPEVTKTIPPGTRLFVFSDGVFEARRDHEVERVHVRKSARRGPIRPRRMRTRSSKTLAI